MSEPRNLGGRPIGSIISSHPKVREINEALLSTSIEKVAVKFDVVAATLRRYRDREWQGYKAEIATLHQEQQHERKLESVYTLNELLAKVNRGIAAAEATMAQGIRNKDWALLSQGNRDLRETAKTMAGLMAMGATDTGTESVIDHPGWIELRDIMVNALAGHPEALAALIRAEALCQ